jgi:hypothetical protein
MTNLEKASFVLIQGYNTPSEEVGGMLYINVTAYNLKKLSVAIHPEQIKDLVERYDNYINRLNQ